MAISGSIVAFVAIAALFALASADYCSGPERDEAILSDFYEDINGIDVFQGRTNMEYDISPKFGVPALRATWFANSLATYAWVNTTITHGFQSRFAFSVLGGGSIADGFTFTLQNVGPHAVGQLGGGLGVNGLARSVSINYDTYNSISEIQVTATVGEGSVMNVNNYIVQATVNPNLQTLEENDQVVQSLITWDAATQVMQVYYHTELIFSVNGFDIHNYLDMGVNDTVYAGFTGGTGGLTQLTEIYAWHFVNDACDADGDGIADGIDGNATNPNVCVDIDQDSCDDCSSGVLAQRNDGNDSEGDGICDVGDICPFVNDNNNLDVRDSCGTCPNEEQYEDADACGNPVCSELYLFLDSCGLSSCQEGFEVFDSCGIEFCQETYGLADACGVAVCDEEYENFDSCGILSCESGYDTFDACGESYCSELYELVDSCGTSQCDVDYEYVDSCGYAICDDDFEAVDACGRVVCDSAYGQACVQDCKECTYHFQNKIKYTEKRVDDLVHGDAWKRSSRIRA